MLLQLPDSCLLTVLQFCADEPRSLFSAARAHSRLHAATVASLHSVTAVIMPHQLLSLMEYLPRHGQHINSISLSSGTLVPSNYFAYTMPRQALCELPASVQLSSLSCSNFAVQLQPGSGYQGVIRANVPLKQLVLCDCILDGGPAVLLPALEAALLQLPQLEHLCVKNSINCFPGDVLSHLTRLTRLELLEEGTLRESTALQHIHKLTALHHLRLELEDSDTLPAEAFKGLDQLTHLYLCFGSAEFHLANLTGKAKLRHLEFDMGVVMGQREGTAALLAEISQLQQLTCLAVGGLLYYSSPCAASYSALTASSSLQHLDLSDWSAHDVAAHVWQLIFPAKRCFPSLHVVKMGEDLLGVGAQDVTQMVGCCPNLRQLNLSQYVNKAELLTPLSGLTGLQQLRVSRLDDAALGVVAGLTGLRDVEIQRSIVSEAALLQLARLRHLTHLHLAYGVAGRPVSANGMPMPLTFHSDEDGRNGPVWKQVLQYCLDCCHPEVVKLAQQTAVELTAAT